LCGMAIVSKETQVIIKTIISIAFTEENVTVMSATSMAPLNRRIRTSSLLLLDLLSLSFAFGIHVNHRKQGIIR
jgi:hypothetical protein